VQSLSSDPLNVVVGDWKHGREAILSVVLNEMRYSIQALFYLAHRNCGTVFLEYCCRPFPVDYVGAAQPSNPLSPVDSVPANLW
jgi:hypothetical protein